eukprot:GEMP01023549.1.p1 GENE.GEMP01023549.1~~GEMP01023549.1.p1  ORF type:complete len:616 (+),score=139.93 GEMP01023549.1:110-1957(+)
MDCAWSAGLNRLPPAGTRARRVGEKMGASLTTFWKPFRVKCSVTAVVEDVFNKDAFYVFFTGSSLSHIPKARLEKSVNPDTSSVEDIRKLGYEHYAISKFLRPEQSMCVYILSKKNPKIHPAFYSDAFLKHGVGDRNEEIAIQPPPTDSKSALAVKKTSALADDNDKRVLPAHPPLLDRRKGRKCFLLEIDYDNLSGSHSTSSCSNSGSSSPSGNAATQDQAPESSQATEAWYDGIDGTEEMEEWEPIDTPLNEDEAVMRTELRAIFTRNDDRRAHIATRAAVRSSTHESMGSSSRTPSNRPSSCYLEAAEPMIDVMDGSKEEETAWKPTIKRGKEDDVFDNPGRFAGRVFAQNDMEMFWHAFALQHLLIEVEAAEQETDQTIITRERFMRVLHTCLSPYRTPVNPRARKKFIRKQTKQFEAVWRKAEPQGPKESVEAHAFMKWLSTDAYGAKKDTAWKNVQEKHPESFLAALLPEVRLQPFRTTPPKETLDVTASSSTPTSSETVSKTNSARVEQDDDQTKDIVPTELGAFPCKDTSMVTARKVVAAGLHDPSPNVKNLLDAMDVDRVISKIKMVPPPVFGAQEASSVSPRLACQRSGGARKNAQTNNDMKIIR